MLQKSTVQVSISSAVVLYNIHNNNNKSIYKKPQEKVTKINMQLHLNNQWLQTPCQIADLKYQKWVNEEKEGEEEGGGCTLQLFTLIASLSESYLS